jgi:C-terminal processing protease CtpA/Prc
MPLTPPPNCCLLGDKTYGKGLIQSVYELSDGSGMAITVGRYLTPDRIDIDRCGGALGQQSPRRKS